MEGLKNIIKNISKNYPKLFQAILKIKKNKIFKKVSIKKLENNKIILSTNDYLSFQIISSNQKKVIEYLNNIFSKENLNIKIESLKILNDPLIENTPKKKINEILIKKIKEIREKLYEHK